MTTSCLNSSQRLPMNVYAENKQNQLFSLYVKKKVNVKLKSLMKSVKNNFGVVTCIGSDSFYVFTRQMLLHLDFNKALNMVQENSDDFQDYHSQQFNLQNIDIDVIDRKKSRRQSIDDELDTSFARANSEEIKNILHAQVNEIQSEYEFSHNQLAEKQLDNHHFKKSNSSFLAQTPVTHKEQKSSTKNYIQKNQQTLSQAQKNYSGYQTTKFDKFSPTEKNKPPNFGEDSFHKDIRQFKQSMQQKKIHESMRQKGMRRVFRNGQEKYVQKNDFIRFYSNKQIGTDKQKRPIQWFYCQLKDTNPESIQSAYLMSSTIVFDLPFDGQPTREQFEKEIKSYFQFYRRLQAQMNRYDDSNCDMPEVVVVCPIEDSQKLQNDKGIFRSLFNQIQSFYITQSKKNVGFSQSPFNQFHKNQSPSKSKLPPTPKRMPMTHKPVENNNGSGYKKRVRLQFRLISQQLQKSGVLRQNYSRMRQITSQGRIIFNQQPIKTMCGNWVTSQCYIHLLQKLSSSLPYVDIETFYEQWQDVFEDFIKSTMEQAAVRYEQKVNELIVGKTMISQARLMQAHEVAKKQTLRQFSQKKIGTSRVYIQTTNNQMNSGLMRLPSISNLSQSHRKISTSRKLVQSRKDLDSRQNQGQVQQQQLLNLVQSRLQQQKQQLSIKAKQESIKWCRKFLATQYQQIRRKLVSNQIKSLTNYKQQLQFLKDIYRKKLQNYSALQYEMIEQYSQFLLQNIFTGLDLLMAKQRDQWRQKLKKQAQQYQQSQLQTKQMKKLLSLKQRSLAEQKIQLQNKLHELQSSLANFTHELQVKNSQITYLKTQHEEKLLQQQLCNKQNTNKLNNSIEQLNKQIATKTNDFMYLQSQLQKQQLLHKQTHTNYQQILSTYKNNILLLQKKIKQLKEVNSINEEQIKSSFRKQQLDELVSKVTLQYEQRIQQMNKLLQEKQRELLQQKNIHEQQLYLTHQQQKSIQTKHTQLLLQQKLTQQKLLEIQSRTLPRYKSIQLQLQKTTKENEYLQNKINTLSQEKALLEQKFDLDQKQFEQTKAKLIEVFRAQCNVMQQQLQKLKQENEQYRQKIDVEKCQVQTQTEFTIRQNEQLTKKTRCRHCKQNQYKLAQAIRIVDALNQSYSRMKSMYKGYQCVHCLGKGMGGRDVNGSNSNKNNSNNNSSSKNNSNSQFKQLKQ